MRLNFQTNYVVTSDEGAELLTMPVSKETKKRVAKPRKTPNVAAARKRVLARYSKTIAYLAK
jgi:hypothetical protein